MITVSEARQRITNKLSIMPSEQVNLNNSLGRVLGEDLIARRTQPPLSVSAMDGYAICSSDAVEAPLKLEVIGSVPAELVFQKRSEKEPQ